MDPTVLAGLSLVVSVGVAAFAWYTSTKTHHHDNDDLHNELVSAHLSLQDLASGLDEQKRHAHDLAIHDHPLAEHDHLDLASALTTLQRSAVPLHAHPEYAAGLHQHHDLDYPPHAHGADHQHLWKRSSTETSGGQRKAMYTCTVCEDHEVRVDA
jgi:hypothetical protein